MRKSSALLVLLLSGALAVPGTPVSAANREHQQMMADIRMLQEQTQQLQVMLGALTEALKTVTSKLDEQVGINRKAFADSKLLVDNVAGDVRVLREKIDDTNVRISTLSQEVEALRLAIPSGPPAGAIDPATGMPSTDAGNQGGGAPALGATPQRMYDSAWADYTSGQWSLAIAGFESYIKSFPKSEQADDAQLYIGQSYYSDGKYNEAVAAFDAVIANYPRGNAVPDAYYKKGLALDRLGQTDRAREAFQLVVRNFPESDAGRLARQRLDQLSRPNRGR